MLKKVNTENQGSEGDSIETRKIRTRKVGFEEETKLEKLGLFGKVLV